MRVFFISLLLISFNSFAGVETLSFSSSKIKVSQAKVKSESFSKIAVHGFELSKKIGAPEVPVKSWLLIGKPENIKVQVQALKTHVIPNLKPFPTQEQECRCENDKKRTFAFDKSLYSNQQPYEVSYLGDFRGTPITRLDVFMANYDAQKNETEFLTETSVQHNAEVFNLAAGSYTDYLIVSTEKLAAGATAFVEWKRAQGYTVNTEIVTAPTLESVSALVKKYYKDNGVDFVILIGDETEIPQYRVSTSGSGQTPSDLKYFTMDGASDNVPDMFSSRIVAASSADVASRLEKAIEYDKKNYKNAVGLQRMIGVASNEGDAPSDNEYVLSIEKSFKDNLNIDAGHLFQGAADSTPTTLNKYLSEGALWMVYLGHGSGTSWPSMTQSYSTSDIAKMSNRESVKPIIIDVACMNGKLKSNYLGASITKVSSESAFGTAAYYGGSVNISWHPPAVMARGIAFEHVKNKYRHLGEALLAGQLYLAANWSNQNDVVDNLEWYHLQGDPGMLIGQ